jgi:SAM-dependent methyltransferase
MTSIADLNSCGFSLVRNILSEELRSLVRQYMDVSHRTGRMTQGRHHVAYGQYEEYGALLSETLLEHLRPTVEAEIGCDLLPTYSFWRIYENGAVLERHTDRPSCEVSLSISVAVEPADIEWPLYLTDYHGAEVPIQLRPGDGLIYMGCDIPHWRAQFQGHVQYQVFLHYVRAIGKHCEYAYDRRPGLAMSRSSVSQPQTLATKPYIDRNRAAWDRFAADRSPFATTATDDDCKRALEVLDGYGWLPNSVAGLDVLCLGSAGGRQSILYASAGANVTVVDISPKMLEYDRQEAERRGYQIRFIESSMDDLSNLEDETFDIVHQPVSTCYVPNVVSVYQEISRVLRPEGLYISQHKEPTSLQVTQGAATAGYVLGIPYYQNGPLPNVLDCTFRELQTVEFLHRWEQLIGGLCNAGFVVEDLREPNSYGPDSAKSDSSHPCFFVAPYVRIKARRLMDRRSEIKTNASNELTRSVLLDRSPTPPANIETSHKDRRNSTKPRERKKANSYFSGLTLPSITKHSIGGDSNIYRTSLIELVDSSSILASARRNCQINQEETCDNDPHKPGLQSNMVIRSSAIMCFEMLVARIAMRIGLEDPLFLGGRLTDQAKFADRVVDADMLTDWDFIFRYWLFIANNTVNNESMGWHTHDLMFIGDRGYTNGFSWSYYLQVPESLEGEEGHIQFANGDQGRSFLPREGDLFCFPAGMLHRVRAAPKSIRERIVLAGNMQIVDALI